jgi:hypothetical protein
MRSAFLSCSKLRCSSLWTCSSSALGGLQVQAVPTLAVGHESDHDARESVDGHFAELIHQVHLVVPPDHPKQRDLQKPGRHSGERTAAPAEQHACYHDGDEVEVVDDIVVLLVGAGHQPMRAYEHQHADNNEENFAPA